MMYPHSMLLKETKGKKIGSYSKKLGFDLNIPGIGTSEVVEAPATILLYIMPYKPSMNEVVVFLYKYLLFYLI